MVITIGEIIQELLEAHHTGKDVNLNKMKTRIASKYGLESSPRLVDIIAAVPQEQKKILLPKLKAKPIRTASGVSLPFMFILLNWFSSFKFPLPPVPLKHKYVVDKNSKIKIQYSINTVLEVYR